jgi:hypothetical protein
MLCFVHIEKTAGTTLHRIFMNNYPDYVHLKPWSLWSNQQENDFTRDEFRYLRQLLPWTRAIGGHSLRVYLGYETASPTPVRYVTFLREPISRYLSHFRYQRDVMRLPWTLESFSAEPRFNNYMTNRLSATGDLEEAKHVLRHQFAFVGLMEQFDRSLVLMKTLLGLERFDTRYEASNVNRRSRRLTGTEYPESLRARLRRNNVLDIELHRFAGNEVFPAYLRAVGADLEGRLRRHLKALKGFRFPYLPGFVSKLYMRAVHRPLEKLLRPLCHAERRAA